MLLALVTAVTLTGCGAAVAPATAPASAAFSAKAVKTEAFPGAGHVVRVNFGNAWDLHFASATKLTYTPANRPASEGATVAVKATPVRPGVWMVTWQESDGTTVTHVEDYENGSLFTNITTADGKFYNLKGTLAVVK
jgi:hypothetical protein